MARKYFKAFNFLKKKGTVAPTITQPRQLKTTMKKLDLNTRNLVLTKLKLQKIELTLLEKENLLREWTN